MRNIPPTAEYPMRQRILAALRIERYSAEKPLSLPSAFP
jgi:hypothetical protein